jgi:hypothetical protein
VYAPGFSRQTAYCAQRMLDERRLFLIATGIFNSPVACELNED